VVSDGQRVALPVVKYGLNKNVASKRHVAMNTRPGATVHANSFGELDVDVVNDTVDSVSKSLHDVRIAPCSLDTSSTSSVDKSQKTISGHAKNACFKCRQCGKLL
jgi:aminoglycoside phosphotransferase